MGWCVKRKHYTLDIPGKGIQYAYVRNFDYKISGCRNKDIQHPCERS